MKILVLTSSFPRFSGDYQGNFIFHLARGQVETGNTVLVVCPHIPGTRFRETMEGVEVVRFPYFYPYCLERLSSGTGMYSALRHSLLAWFQLPLFVLCQFLMVRRITREQNTDIIHSHWIVPQGLMGGLCHRLFRIPHITTIHGTDMNLVKTSRVLRIACRFIVRNSAAVTVNSAFMKKQLESVVPGITTEIHTIPMGVDPAAFRTGTDPEDQKKTHDENIILNVGRLIDWKGTACLVAAMPEVLSRFPSTKLVIIGTGPQEETLRQQVRNLHLEKHVEFAGTVSDMAMKRWYQAADVFVLPSLVESGKTEGLGVVLLEAMASGCPVIGSSVGGIPDIITDGKTGLLVPERDSHSLAKSIIAVLSDPELRRLLTVNGYERVCRQFAWETITGRFSSVYRQILNPKGGIQPPAFQTGFSGINPSLFDEKRRLVKSKKILAVLEDVPDLPLAACRTLEVGCSTGFNTIFLADRCQVCTGIDIDGPALRFARDRGHPRTHFVLGDAMNLPFPDNRFDVVICNHVYEHVPDYGRLMDEIFRTLRPGGVCYFAAGNKYSLIEGHYHLPFLSWIPKSAAHIYLRVTGRGSEYYENHLSYPALCRLVHSFTMTDYTLKVIRNPARFGAEDMIRSGSILSKIPEWFLQRVRILIPTFIFILKKPMR